MRLNKYNLHLIPNASPGDSDVGLLQQVPGVVPRGQAAPHPDLLHQAAPVGLSPGCTDHHLPNPPGAALSFLSCLLRRVTSPVLMSFWGYCFSLLFFLRSFFLSQQETSFINKQTFEPRPLCLCAGSAAVPWHLGLHDGSGGDRGPGADMPGHLQTPARRLRAHAGHRPVRLSPPRTTAQGLPACSKGKARGRVEAFIRKLQSRRTWRSSTIRNDTI